MRIIPAIDIIDGKCVRLSKGDYNKKTIYSNDPVEVAKSFEGAGVKYLHLVDLDGAKSKQIINQKVLERIALQTNLKIDFGGGLKTDEDVKIAFNSGASQITGGSIAANNPEMFLNWLELYGPNKIILGADCKGRMIATNGWLKSSELNVIDFINDYSLRGIKYVVCTDIDKDGMLEGTSNKLYKEILEKSNTNLIASGGVSSLKDLTNLQSIGCEGVIIGKAIYEGKITLKDLEKLC